MNDIKQKETEVFFQEFEDQKEFAEAVLSGKYKNLMFAGDIRSGKTIIILALLILLCKVYAGSKWCVVRESIPKLKKNTIPTFFKYCCPPNYVKPGRSGWNKSDLIFTGRNNSQILFVSENFDNDPELQAFLGFEANGFFLNQSDELQREMFNMSVMRRGQWRIDPMPPALTLMDCNPTNNWSKSDFYDPFMSGSLPDDTYLKLANMTKNPYITDEYKADLKRTLPKELYERFCNNNWDMVDAIFQLTSWEAIRNCKEKLDCASKEKFLGCDIGRDGPDPTKLWLIEGDNFVRKYERAKTKITEAADMIEQVIIEERIDPSNVCIDGVGLGGGVIDILVDKGYDGIIEFIGGAACDEEIPETHIQFANARSFSNWLLSQQLKDKKIGNFTDAKLTSDAGAIKYEIKSDKKLYIMSKEEIKKKLKRSPDDWDAACYANWARMKDYVEPLPGVSSV